MPLHLTKPSDTAAGQTVCQAFGGAVCRCPPCRNPRVKKGGAKCPMEEASICGKANTYLFSSFPPIGTAKKSQSQVLIRLRSPLLWSQVLQHHWSHPCCFTGTACVPEKISISRNSRALPGTQEGDTVRPTGPWSRAGAQRGPVSVFQASSAELWAGSACHP